jgi:ribosomal protein L22
MTPPAPKDPKKDKADEAAAEEKPKRTRAKKADAEAPAEKAAAKPRASRAKKADEGEEKPKPARAPAKKKADEAVAEPTAEEPKAEEVASTEEPKAEEAAAAEEPKADETAAAEEPTAEKPAPKKPAAKKKGEKADEKKPGRSTSRRRNGHVPAGVTVHAQAKYVRTSARKARLVCDHIRGKDVAEARAILAFTPRAAAKAWIKLLESAVANAEHNHELVGEELRIYSVHADEGPTLKRYRPRAMGRATRIRKRTSHLSITLTPKES